MIFPKPVFTFLGLTLLGACASLMPLPSESVQRGQLLFANECAQCHGVSGEGAGPASLGLGVKPPDLTGLTDRNDGAFPRAFVQRFVLGQLEKDDPDAAMPEFAKVGFEHVVADSTEVSGTDMIALLDYLETIQR